MKTISFKIVRVIALVVCVAGAAVVAGWLWDVTALKSILPSLPSMKFSGAVGFVLSGFTLYLIALSRRDSDRDADLARTLLPITTLGIMLLTIPALASVIIGFNFNIESLFIANASGRPALGAIAGYVILAVGGLVVFDNPRRSDRLLTVVGIALCVIGGLALLGYAIKAPILYYYFIGMGRDISTAMALHSAALFALLGAGLILTGSDHNGHEPVNV